MEKTYLVEVTVTLEGTERVCAGSEEEARIKAEAQVALSHRDLETTRIESFMITEEEDEKEN